MTGKVYKAERIICGLTIIVYFLLFVLESVNFIIGFSDLSKTTLYFVIYQAIINLLEVVLLYISIGEVYKWLRKFSVFEYW